MSLDTLSLVALRRLALEAQAVEAKFPGRFRLAFREDGLPAWTGSVPIEGEDFPVRVSYPPAYPAAPPLLETSLPIPPACPHILGRQGVFCKLCWLSPQPKSLRQKWQPDRQTAATALRAAQRWGLAFLVWKAIGVWPVPDAWEV